MKLRKKHGVLFILLAVTLLVGCSQKEDRKANKTECSGEVKKENNSTLIVRTIQVKNLFNIGDLKPGFGQKKKPTLIDFRLFDVDKEGNLYFLDFRNNRVMKYKQDGTFICQIGNTGNNLSGLFKPTGIRIDNNNIYINDSVGMAVKKFSLNGEYISSFSIKGVKRGSYFDIYDNKIYSNIRMRVKEYKKEKLIHVFSPKGEKLSLFGKTIQCQNRYGYYTFNSTYFSIRKGHLVGAFVNQPIIFHYNLRGDEIFFIDLRDLGIPEIKRIEKAIISENLDRPMKIRDNNGYLESKTYCEGFDIDSDLHSYYIYNRMAGAPYILHFDEKGKVVEKMLFKNNEVLIRPTRIFIDKNTDTGYVIGKSESKKLLLISFDLK